MKTLDRREFLAGLGAVAGGAFFAACAPAPAAPTGAASPSATPFKIKLAFVSVSAANSAIWAAEDGGYLKKYGLAAEVVNIADSTQAVPALLTGDTPVNCGLSGTAVVASGLSGSDLIFVGVTINTFPSSIYVKSSITSAAALKGGKVGVTRFGTASDTAGKIGLKQLGLDPAKDVTLIQTGGLNESLAAMQTGQIDGGVLSPPVTLLARNAGFRELVDVSTAGVEYVYNGIATSRNFAKQNPAVIENVLKAVIEGMHRFKTDAEFGKKVTADRTKLTDSAQVEETWRLFATKYLKEPPYLTDAGLKTVLDELVPNNAKAKDATSSSFYDNSYLKRLEDGGFLKSVTGS